jgi:hypothetical protein
VGVGARFGLANRLDRQIDGKLLAAVAGCEQEPFATADLKRAWGSRATSAEK